MNRSIDLLSHQPPGPDQWLGPGHSHAGCLVVGRSGAPLFCSGLAAALMVAAFCQYRGRHHKRHLGPGEGAWYMVSAWVLLGLLGMIPYVMAGIFASPVDAFFESVSAFTTTGTSCLADGGVALPQSLLLWHSLMEWLGGLNFILMLVSVMPQSAAVSA